MGAIIPKGWVAWGSVPNAILGRNMGYWEEVLVSGRDAGAGTNSWIGAEHLSWAKVPPPGETAAMVRKARAGVKPPSRVKFARTA